MKNENSKKNIVLKKLLLYLAAIPNELSLIEIPVQLIVNAIIFKSTVELHG